MLETLPNGFRGQFKDLRFNVLSVPNAATAKEVFVENIYDIFFPFSDMVLLDIGFNVGYASLFFSLDPRIKHIYGFEPFESTVYEAKENLQLNPAVENRITIYTSGISDYDGTIEVPMLESGSAVGSINENMINQNAKNLHAKNMVEVQVADITKVLHNTRRNHPHSSIIIKLDCEGEEYKVIQTLEDHTLLSDISFFIIEWHLKGPEPIVQLLQKNNFTIIHLPRHIDTGLESAETGMIYALRTSYSSPN